MTTTVPLWQRILDDLERRIATGEFTERFPTDRELTEHYGVSRFTVREAVRHLRARGIVDRFRGRGSFLSDQHLRRPLGTLTSLFAEVEDRGIEQRSEVLRFDEVHDAEAAAHLGRRRDVTLTRLERLRLADGVPLALDSVWLPATVGRKLRDADFTHTALYDELAARADVRITAVDETIAAQLPDDDTRRVLQLDDDEALLRVRRLGYAGDEAIECRVTLVRGSRFVYTSSTREDRGDEVGRLTPTDPA